MKKLLFLLLFFSCKPKPIENIHLYKIADAKIIDSPCQLKRIVARGYWYSANKDSEAKYVAIWGHSYGMHHIANCDCSPTYTEYFGDSIKVESDLGRIGRGGVNIGHPMLHGKLHPRINHNWHYRTIESIRKRLERDIVAKKDTVFPISKNFNPNR